MSASGAPGSPRDGGATDRAAARSALLRRQAGRFATLMAEALDRNPFYRGKYAGVLGGGEVPGLDDLPRLPFTEKAELAADQARNPPFGTDLSRPLADYTRAHQTSGTTGRPLRWLDTPESWSWWLDCWVEIYRAAGVGPGDRLFLPFSFGPFVGFWAAFEAGPRLGALTIPGGGLTTRQRVRALLDYEATVIVCTPTYALRLADVAREEGHDLAAGSVRVTVHAGEPGASLPNVRRRLEEAWGARCVDHAGATEVGAWGWGCGHGDRMHVHEEEFVAEAIDPVTLDPAPVREGVRRGELVLTNLGRTASPVARYRTGDLVELSDEPCPCGRATAWLRGGVLGRVDGMVTVRGVNVYPAAVDDIVHAHPAVVEYEARVESRRSMADLVLRVELRDGRTDAVEALARDVHDRLHLRPRIEVVAPRSLPRYELKARRFKVAGVDGGGPPAGSSAERPGAPGARGPDP